MLACSATQDVWNRARHRSGGTAPGPGDSALVRLIRLHDTAVSGGLPFAAAFLSTDEFHAGIAGYRYFGLDEPAALLEAAKLCGCDESTLALLDQRYRELVPRDEILVSAFEAVYRKSPGDFAPF